MKRKIKLNKTYDFEYINDFAEAEAFDIEESGNNCIGENFLVLRSQKYDEIISFVLNGASSRKYFYKCIYKDNV
jgi:hypothetical protein